MSFFRTKQTQIIAGNQKPVTLKGVNLGGWLMMEGYILHAPNFPEQKFKKEFASIVGKSALKEFERKFRDHFIQEWDIQNIATLGMNCVRVPFNCRLVESKPYHFDPSGVAYLDRVIQWGKKYGVGIILDLHAAPGAQNHDWHSDSYGAADLWKKKVLQKRTYGIWEFLADRYKDNPTVIGYDILNEAVLTDTKLLNAFYKELIKCIRRVDRNHIIFVEGNRWAQDLEVLEDFNDDNLALSVHYYAPIEFVFNIVPQLSYPLKKFDRGVMRRQLHKYYQYGKKYSRPIYVGEFGVNARQGLYGEDRWLADILHIFQEFNFHWTYWTYKAVKNGLFPDGILSFLPNDPWINRQGPKSGWDTYSTHWPQRQGEIIRSWLTQNFSPNRKILKVLKNAL